MKTKPSLQRVSIVGMRSLAMTKKQIIAVLGSAKLVDRSCGHSIRGWGLIYDQDANSLSTSLQIWSNFRQAAYYPACRFTRISVQN